MYPHIYVHFPFCEARCHYCDFYALGAERTNPNDPVLFEQAVRAECEIQAPKVAAELQTVFFGGGTPSMTSYDSMARALEPLWKQTRLSKQGEWTMEANPSSITLESITAYRKYGVNRLSMGVQALKPQLLQKLGRVHSRTQALTALETVFKGGFENVSVDLLCGVPGQSLDDLSLAIKELTNYPIQHLSCYLLTLPKHHRMYPELPDEDVQLEHLLHIHNELTQKGFEHYEISNFCRPGKKAQHNLAYWKGQSYLGLGPSAHSFDSITQTRWKNVSSLHRYATLLTQGTLPSEPQETLTSDQIHLEKWMLALRLSEGVPVTWLSSSLQRARALTFEQQGLLEPNPDDLSRLRLTARGFALSDQIISALV